MFSSQKSAFTRVKDPFEGEDQIAHTADVRQGETFADQKGPSLQVCI